MKKSIKERKDALIEKLKTLKSELKGSSSPSEFNFTGNCGQQHAIETKVAENIYGITSGQFIESRCCCGVEELCLCVGVGEGCKDEDDEKGSRFLWFLKENDEGVSYWDANTLQKLQQKITVVLVP